MAPLRLKTDPSNISLLQAKNGLDNGVHHTYVQQQLQEALDRIFSEPDFHQQYLKWLSQLNDQQRIAEQMLHDGSKTGPFAVLPLGTAMTTVDPNQQMWNIGKIAGINQDFVNALRQQDAFLRSGDIDDAMRVNKYSNGSYINAFGSPTGSPITFPAAPPAPSRAPSPFGIQIPAERSGLSSCEILCKMNSQYHPDGYPTCVKNNCGPR